MQGVFQPKNIYIRVYGDATTLSRHQNCAKDRSLSLLQAVVALLKINRLDVLVGRSVRTPLVDNEISAVFNCLGLGNAGRLGGTGAMASTNRGGSRKREAQLGNTA